MKMYKNLLMQTLLPEKFHTSHKEKNVNGFGLSNIFSWYLSVLLFVLPLLFVPIVADPFGLARTYLIVFSACVLSLVFFGYRSLKGKLFVYKVTNYLPLLMFLLASLVGVFFSLNKNISIFGGYGNNDSSLLFFFSLVLIGFIVSSIKVNMKMLVNGLILGTTLSVVVSLLFYFGVLQAFIPEAIAEFTLVGSPDRLFSLQVLVVALSLLMLANGKISSKLDLSVVSWGFYLSAIIINVLYLLIGGSLYAVAALIASVCFVLYFRNKELSSKPKLYVIYAVCAYFIMLSVLLLIPTVRTSLNIKSYNQEVRLPLKESWYVSVSSLRDYPLFGTGLGNFFKNYSLYRPQSVNDTKYWEFRFVKPFNDIFFWLSCAGFVGFILFIMFLALTLKSALAFDRRSASSSIAAIAILSSLAVMLFIGFSIYTMLVLFISLGYLVNKSRGQIITLKSRPFILVLTVITLLLSAYLFYRLAPVASAQYFYRQSLMTNNAVDKYNLQRQAIGNDPFEVTYRADNVLTGLFIAKELANRENLSDNDKEQAIALIKQSVDDSLTLSELIDPYNVAVWELRGLVYNTISDVVSNANAFAVDAYQKAIQLESSNPKLWVVLGGIYYKYNAFQDAAIAFNRAVILKPDYANARYNLAHTLIKIGDIQNAIAQMETVLTIVKPGTDDYTKAQKDLEDFKKLYQELVNKAEQEQKNIQESGNNTVTQVESVNSNQESLSTPGSESTDGKLDPQKLDKEKLQSFGIGDTNN